MKKRETVVQMTIKTKKADYLEIIDRYSGTPEGALNLLHGKYVEPGWLERFEKRMKKQAEEWDAILKKREDERKQQLHNL